MELKDFLEDEIDTNVKVKIFAVSQLHPAKEIEEEINEWLSEQSGKIEIMDVKQSVTVGEYGKDITISIWYKEY